MKLAKYDLHFLHYTGMLRAINRSSTVTLSLLALMAISPIPEVTASDFPLREITINDCDGVTRAQLQIPGTNRASDLHVELVDDAPAPKSLTLSSGTERLESAVTGGNVTFSNLEGGIYQLCDQGKLARISQLYLQPVDENSAAGIGGIIGGAVAVGGAVLAMNSGGGSDNEQQGSTNTNTLAGSSGLKEPGKLPAPLPATAANNDCLNSDNINPISPFS